MRHQGQSFNQRSDLRPNLRKHRYSRCEVLMTASPAHRIFVPGNHDRIFYHEPTRAKNLVPGGVMYLEDEGIELDGIKFYSVPVRPYLTALPDIPKDIDFLITHGPAWGYLDRGMGDKYLFLAMGTARPKYHIFGHIHEDGLKREAMLGGTTYLNVAYFEYLHSIR